MWLDVRDVRGVKGMCRYVSGVNVSRCVVVCGCGCVRDVMLGVCTCMCQCESILMYVCACVV